MFTFSKKPRIRCRRFYRNGFFFDSNCRCFPVSLVTSLFRAVTTSEAFSPTQLTAGPQTFPKHFHGVLVTEQAFGKGSAESFDNSLVAVNFNAPAPYRRFVVFHHFRNSAHKFALGVNLQHVWPRQRRALVNLLKALGDLIRIFRGKDSASL